MYKYNKLDYLIKINCIISIFQGVKLNYFNKFLNYLIESISTPINSSKLYFATYISDSEMLRVSFNEM